MKRKILASNGTGAYIQQLFEVLPDASTATVGQVATVKSDGTVGYLDPFLTGGVAIGGTLTANKFKLPNAASANLFDNSTDNPYLNVRVIQNQSALNADGLYVGYANAGSAMNRIFDGGSSNYLGISSATLSTIGLTKFLFGNQADDGTFAQFSGDVKFKGKAFFSGGNVGIGTNSPTSILDVLGTTRFQGVVNFGMSGLGGLRIDGSSADGIVKTIQSYAASPLAINPFGNNVGIGTNSPTSTLDVLGTTRFQGVVNFGMSGLGGLIIDGSSANGVVKTIQSYGSSPLSINPLGNNVGIGTINPISPLQIAGVNPLAWNPSITANTIVGVGGIAGSSFFVNTPSLNANYHSGLGVDGFYTNPSGVGTSIVNIKALGVNSNGGYDSNLAFWTTLGLSSTEKMRILSNGNVGIGTTTPITPLDVLGGINSSNAYYLGGINLAAYAGLYTNNVNVRVIANSSGTGAYADGMYIGYGSSSSGATRIFDGGTANYLTLGSATLSTTGLTKFLFGNQADDGTFAQFSGAVNIKSNLTVANDVSIKGGNSTNAGYLTANSANGGLYLGAYGTNQNIRFAPSGTGYSHFMGNAFFDSKIGIGLTNPSYKLHIASNTADTQPVAFFQNINSAGFTGIQIDRIASNRYALTQYSTAGVVDWNTGVSYGSGSANSIYSIGTGINLTDSKLSILPSGYVGIGTSTPTDKLQVVGDLSSQGTGLSGILHANLYLRRNDGMLMYGIGAKNPLVTNSSFDFNSINGNAISFSISSSEKVSILPSGYTGIGTTNPLARLDVRGNGHFTNGTIKTRIREDGIIDFTNFAETTYANGGFYASQFTFNGGNGGFGTLTPISTLSVQSVASIGSKVVMNLNNPYAYGTGLGLATTVLRFNRTPNDAGLTGVMADIWAGNESESTSSYGFLAFATRSGVSEATTERMRIGSNGYVGIGTTSPTATLDVNGTIKGINFKLPNSASANLFDNSTDNPYLNVRVIQNSSVIYQDGMYIGYNNRANAGNYIFDGTSTNYLNLSSGTISTLGITKFLFGNQADDGTFAQFSGDVKFKGKALFSGGNVGIGLTNPAAALHISGGKIIAGTSGSTNGSIVLESLYDQTGTYGAISTLGTNYSSGGWVMGYGVSPKSGVSNSFTSSTPLALSRSAIMTDGDFRFLTGASQTVAIGSDAVLTEKMRISNNGYVGIGTTSPLAKLDVRGTTHISDGTGTKIRLRTGGIIDFTDFAETGYAVGSFSASKFTFTGGNVGIGSTVAPISTLQVNGSLSVGTGVNASDIGIMQFLVTGASPFSNRITYGTDGTGYKFGIGKNQAGVVTDQIVIQDNGNVGIGTTNPTKTLDVNGSIGISGAVTTPFRTITGATGTYTILANDHVVLIDTSPACVFNVDVPSATNVGREIVLVNKSIGTQYLGQNYINSSRQSTNQLPYNTTTRLKYDGINLQQI